MQNSKCKMLRTKCRMQNAKPTLRSENRGQTCLRYAEPQGGKACEAGLMQNAKCEICSKIAKKVTSVGGRHCILF